jgi:hypothetical protein
MRTSESGIEANGFFQRFTLLGGFSQSIKGQSHIVVGARTLRVLCQSLAIQIGSALVLANLKIFVGLVDLRPGYVVFDALLFLLLEAFQFLTGSLLMAQAPQHRRQLKSSFARCRIQLRRLFKMNHCLLRPSQLRKNKAQIVLSVVMIRVKCYCLPEHVFSRCVVSKPAVNHSHQVKRVKVVRLATNVVLDFGQCRLELRQDNQRLHIRKSGDVIAWIQPQRLAELLNCLSELRHLRVGETQPGVSGPLMKVLLYQPCQHLDSLRQVPVARISHGEVILKHRMGAPPSGMQSRQSNASEQLAFASSSEQVWTSGPISEQT